MHRLVIPLGDRAYPILIGPDLLSPEHVQPWLGNGPVLVVSNETVAPLYLNRVEQALQEHPHQPLVLPDGEQWKTLATWERILHKLTDMGATRDCTLIALGGGVIGDITGFAAASYMRGVRFLQIPTTLLAQVDASVGGKTGVNLPAGKNLVGAFHQPAAVIIDTDTLNTLPQREYLAGLAEVVKYGLISDAEFFHWLETNQDRLLQREADALAFAIHRSCRNKAEVVAADEREQGRRALLNLGHTFGHAIETATGYTRYLHGEAVAIGMCLAAAFSERLGLAEPPLFNRTRDLLQGLGLPVSLPADISAQSLAVLMRLDKKNLQGSLRLILLRGMGQAFIDDTVEERQVIEFLASYPG